MSPCAHLSDGYLDLIAVKGCSRPEYLQHLVRLTDPTKVGCVCVCDLEESEWMCAFIFVCARARPTLCACGLVVCGDVGASVWVGMYIFGCGGVWVRW